MTNPKPTAEMKETDEQKKTEATPMLTGWICPRCGKVHSPFSMQCDCQPEIRVWTGTSTEIDLTNEP